MAKGEYSKGENASSSENAGMSGVDRTHAIENKTPSEQIDSIIAKHNDWRGTTLSGLRSVIMNADESIIEEVKWRKPSRPEGVPVWSSGGIICVADILKNAVRLTFFKGALLSDPNGVFNTRMDSRTVRAVDYHQGDIIAENDLGAIVMEAVHINRTKNRDTAKRQEK